MESHDPSRSPTLPPIRLLQRILRTTLETLVAELRAPTRTTPAWNELEWRIAEATCVIHGISALLASRIRWRGPDRWHEFLEGQAHQTELRRQLFMELLNRLDAAGRTAGVPLMALKGAALYRAGVYPLGDRPMSDIDLLTSPADANRAGDLIETLGFRRGLTTPRHHAFHPLVAERKFGFGENVKHPIKIELHERVAERLPVAEVDITGAILNSDPQPGVSLYPTPAALMRHLLLHAAGNMRARALRFLQLHDIALVSEGMQAADWRHLLDGGHEGKSIWWALAPLQLTQRHYPGTIPDSVLDSVAEGCPALLRRAVARKDVTSVSWTQLHIEAFPGIEWAHSVSEALRFMSERLFPSRRHLSVLQDVIVPTPYGSSVAWYGLSHVNRIVRWVFSNPPRVQAIYPIRVALGIQAP